MAKKKAKKKTSSTKPTLRKPPSRAAKSAFVNGKKGADDRERQTLLLPGPLRKNLKLRAIEDGIEISQVVEAALIKYGVRP